MARIKKQSISKKELKSLQDDMIAMQQQLKEQSINDESIAKFILNHMFVNNNQCVNSYSSSCVSCPYRYDCKYSDSNDISMRILVI
jgi:hypothetical protein